jgi:DNA-binding NarL/FixJ family response regulator
MRVLIIDDHPMTRSGLSLILKALDPGVETIEAGSCAEAIALRDSHVDLVLLDMGLPDADPATPARIDALERVKPAFEGSPVVIVSGQDDPKLIRAAIDRGASGYMTKTIDRNLIVAAMRVVLAEGIYLPPTALLDRDSEVRPAPVRDAGRVAASLSTRQRQVLDMALQGKANKVIGRALGISEGTVKAHLSRVYAELGVGNRTEALYAIANNSPQR